MATSKTAWTRESFLAATAKALWEIHQAKRLRTSVGEALGRFGIGVPEDAAGDSPPAFTFPADPPDTYVGGGLTLADLTDAAKAKREAKQVTQLRQEVYSHLRAMTSSGTCARGPDCPNHGQQAAPAEIVRHFDALGFPKPVTRTTIEGYVLDGDNGPQYIAVTIAGEMTEAEAKAKLEPQGKHSRQHNMTVAAFGNDASSEQLVTSLYVRPRVTWTDAEDIT